MEGWGKTGDAAKYAGVSPRTLGKWLKNGLRCARLPTGTILVKFEWIDEFIGQFEGSENIVDSIVDDFCKGIRG